MSSKPNNNILSSQKNFVENIKKKISATWALKLSRSA